MEQLTAVYNPLPRWENRLHREPCLDIDEWTLLAEARIVPPEVPAALTTKSNAPAGEREQPRTFP